MRFLCAVALACCAASFVLLRESSAAPAPAPEPAPSAPGDVPNGLQDDGTIVVPVARNFSSIKELIQILQEERSSYPSGDTPQGRDTLGARPNGTHIRDDSYAIFITD